MNELCCESCGSTKALQSQWIWAEYFGSRSPVLCAACDDGAETADERTALAMRVQANRAKPNPEPAKAPVADPYIRHPHLTDMQILEATDVIGRGHPCPHCGGAFNAQLQRCGACGLTAMARAAGAQPTPLDRRASRRAALTLDFDRPSAHRTWRDKMSGRTVGFVDERPAPWEGPDE